MHPVFFQSLLTLPSLGMYPASIVGAGEVLSGSGSSLRDEVRARMGRSFWRHRGRTQRGARHTWWEPGLWGWRRQKVAAVHRGSVKCVCVSGGDHICDCEGDCSVSLCEPREGPLFLPSHCILVLRTGKRGGADREALESNLRQLSWPEGAQGPQGLSDEAALRLGLER